MAPTSYLISLGTGSGWMRPFCEWPQGSDRPDRKTADHYDYEGPAVCVPMVSSSGHGKADVKRLHYQEGKFAVASTMLCLTPKPDSNSSARYLYQLLTEKKDVLIVPLMAGATNVTLKQDLFEEVMIPVPSSDVQREIVEHAEWELLEAVKHSDTRWLKLEHKGLDRRGSGKTDCLVAKITVYLVVCEFVFANFLRRHFFFVPKHGCEVSDQHTV